jgi:hypothetical protein
MVPIERNVKDNGMKGVQSSPLWSAYHRRFCLILLTLDIVSTKQVLIIVPYPSGGTDRVNCSVIATYWPRTVISNIIRLGMITR